MKKWLMLTQHPTLREMFKEENRKAEELLEAAAQHHQELQQRCQQLQQKRQR
jgi:synaptonemal complex central element protein 1